MSRFVWVTAVLWCCLGCQNNAPDKLMAEIQQMGGSCTIDDKRPDKPIVMVNLGMSSATDAFVARLSGLTELQGLYLWQTGVTDAGLQHLKSFTKLEKLDLSGTTISDAGLQHLKSLTNLKEVKLSGAKVSPQAVKELQKALPRAKITR